AYIRSLHFVSRSVDFFFFMLRPPPTSTLFPYTTLFRSDDITPSELKGTRTIVFSTSGRPPTPSMHRIDGKLFDGVVCAAVVLNTSEEHTSELQSRENLVCRLLLEKKKKKQIRPVKQLTR